jgi:hypothetical protein
MAAVSGVGRRAAKRVPTLGILCKLADAYGVNICDLLPGDTPPDVAPAKGKPASAAPGPGKRAKGKGPTRTGVSGAK